MAPALDLTKTIGALLIGIIFSSILYGVTILQAFLYFQNYPSDTLLIKGSVILLLIVETLHSIFSVHAIYYYLVSNYMNPVALEKAIWSATLTLVSSAAIIFLVHLFYIRRVYHVTKKKIVLVIPLVLLALANLGTSTGICVRSFQLQFYAKFGEPDVSKLSQAALVTAALNDILISGLLSFYLHKSRSGMPSTDTLINKLLVYTINNGILTSALDIIVLIFFVTVTTANDLRYLAIFQVVGNVYTNSILATLNSRRSIRGAGRDLDTIEAGGAAFRGRGISGGTVNVAMANLTFVKGDDNPTSSSRTPVALKDYKKPESFGDIRIGSLEKKDKLIPM